MTTYPIPPAGLDDRLAFVGTSGSGKTYAAGTAVERLLKTGAKVVVVDPLGVWYGLRVHSDGKTAAFPVVIFGGQHADIPLTEHGGAIIGETVAGMAESCIVSLSDFPTKAAERRFMLAFLERLYRKATGEPFHLVFDEADLWAPQKSSEPQLQNLMEQIVRRGRVKGFIPWLITQRPAVLSKDVLSQADGLVAMKLTSSQDRDALGAWIEGQADKSEEKRIKARLAQLSRGEAVVWIPGRSILNEAKFPEKVTFDSSSTPKRGETKRAATLKPIDIGKVRERLASVEDGQKKPTKQTTAPAARPAASAPPAAPDPRALREAEDAGRRIGFEDGKRVGYAEGYQKAVREAQAALSSLKASESTLASLPPRPTPTPKPVPQRPVSIAPADGSLPTGEKICLNAIAQYAGGVRREQLQVLTGYKRSSRDAYIARLRGKGFVELNGENVVATPAGISALGSDYDPLPTGDALRERVLRDLPEGERKVLEVLLSRYPSAVDRTEIDLETDYKRSSRDAYIARLKLRKLVVTQGSAVKASDDLFDEAA